MVPQYSCKKEQRRAQVLTARDVHGNPFLNGIDYLEVDTVSQKTLHVHFLFNLPGTSNGVPASPALTAANIAIDGGERITGIRATSVTAANNVLSVTVDAAGDFSTYTLRLITSAKDVSAPAGFDPQLSAVDFSFKVTCPSDFDCQPVNVCPTPPASPFENNYLAKDYASFRQLILDRMARTTPGWIERSPADLGVTLVELLAYAGDQLSYFQDAVATEAYLGTARRRVSVRRHARLLDYPMHDGCNSRTWVLFHADPGAPVPVPRGTMLLTQAKAPRGRLLQTQVLDALNQGAVGFETLADVTVRSEWNSLNFYTWSDDQCCLPQGATEATLVDSTSGHPPAVGDLLLFEEVLGTATGQPADADTSHRQVVRLTSVKSLTDPLNGQAVLGLTWDPADALPFPLCLSTVVADQTGTHSFPNVSVARGNLVLADYGLSQPAETLPPVVAGAPLYRPRLRQSGITVSAAYDDHAARALPAADVLAQDPQQALPDITLTGNGTWTPVRDLLASDRTALNFVVETEEDGASTLRFGDGILGARPVSNLQANYRVGNGVAGNVGAEAIAYLVVPTPASLAGISGVRNPLPATGGADPERLDEVRQFAPWAYRTQERAVTVADYAAVAERYPEVQRAQAVLRWTGSWYTMFVTVERAGGQPVDAPFRTRVRDFLEQFRLAGYDLEIEAPRFVSLDIAFTVCVAPGYFRSAVQTALLNTFSNHTLPDGTSGFFHPDNYTFGQPVFISQIVAAAMKVPGVKWVDTNDIPPAPNHFTRLGQPSHGEAAAGEIRMATLEIARLDNDPSRPENGKIRFFMEGGL
jgi:hypothetical protein